MGRFIGALSLLLLLPLIVEAIDRLENPIENCPKNNVCILFLQNVACTVQGEARRGYAGFVWDPSTHCGRPVYYNLYARLEITLTSLTSWKIIVTAYEDINRIEFSFEHATLKFRNEHTADLVWNSTETNGNASFQMETLPKVETPFSRYNYPRYEFHISADNQKLVRLLGGSEVTYKSTKDPKIIEMKDEHYSELLDQYTHCDFAELNRVCYDTCDDITYDAGFPVNCSTNLWFHSPSESGLNRHWQRADNISCRSGGWLADWSNGSQPIDASHEVQCSAMDPAKMTSKMQYLLGFGVGIPLLLILIVILVCFILWRRRRANKDGSETKKFATLRSSPENAQTPQTPKKGKSDRNASSTDIEGLQTEKFSKDKTTNREVPPELKTMKWNEDHGVIASKPSTPAIYRPPPPASPFKPQEPKGASAAAGPPLPTGFASQTM